MLVSFHILGIQAPLGFNSPRSDPKKITPIKKKLNPHHMLLNKTQIKNSNKT
jgi:hypothetical protein